MTRKMDELYAGIPDNQQLFYGDILNPKFRRVFYFFATHIDLEVIFKECGDQIEATLSML